LTPPLIKEGVFESTSQMEHNEALGPDGFPTEFYQKIWDVIKTYLMELFVKLHNGELPSIC
jgi:hypothetical protein